MGWREELSQHGIADYETMYRETDYMNGVSMLHLRALQKRFDTSRMSVVDVGCGRMGLKHKLKCRSYTGVDIISTAEIVAPAHQLPFNDKTFDLAIMWDVFEHIPEDLVDASIKEVVRVARNVSFSISLSPNPEPGVHVTVKPASWWMTRVPTGWCRVTDVELFVCDGPDLLQEEMLHGKEEG